MISKYPNVSSYNDYSIIKIFCMAISFYLDHPDPVERETIFNPNKKPKHPASLESNPDPVHH